jgi:hypothetical protein
LNPDANFCGNCGAPRKPVQQSVQSLSPLPFDNFSAQPLFPTPTWQRTAERVLGFIIVSKPKQLGGQDFFTGIITTTQLIFVPMTKEMLREVTDGSKQDTEREDGTSMAKYPYQEVYLGIPPSAILSRTPGTFAIQNSSIKEIDLKLVSASSDEYADFQEYEMQIVSELQTLAFRMTKRDEYVRQLAKAFQGKVRAPVNY